MAVKVAKRVKGEVNMNFDIIYINGNIITVDPSLPNAGWVAIKDGRIAAIGTENPPTSLSAKTIDLEGRTCLLYTSRCV